jgi:hypothetical protein
MKDLKNILLEASLLDIDGTMEEGDKFENVNLTSLYNSKSKGEFEAKFKVFRSMIEDKNTEVTDIKPRKTYIAFQEVFPKKYDPDLCYVSIFIGTNKDLYHIVWVHDSINRNHKVRIERKELVNLEYVFDRRDFGNAKRTFYVCPKKIKDEANKLIIYNLK